MKKLLTKPVREVEQCVELYKTEVTVEKICAVVGATCAVIGCLQGCGACT